MRECEPRNTPLHKPQPKQPAINLFFYNECGMNVEWMWNECGMNVEWIYFCSECVNGNPQSLPQSIYFL